MMQKDGFDKKREMIKMLMDMLKKHASDEVTGPHMTDMSQTNGMQQKTSDSSMMADGGMALPSDEPENVMPSELLEAEGAEHAAPEMGEIEMEDEGNNSSSFMGLMKRKKK